MTALFSSTFLRTVWTEFQLANVPGIRAKKESLENLLSELISGKLESLKEEEVKSRFVNIFFGDVLGFNYGNANAWLLREEKKTKVDGTKPDAVLGYFARDRGKDDVRVVIEIKNATTELEEKQKRKDTKSPVDQAFEYAPKMGGACQWVVVSNMKETRFYAANDRSKYQVFFLNELMQEEKLKELLFLFSREHFINAQGHSLTNRLLTHSNLAAASAEHPAHVLDELYECAKQFDGIHCVDPNFIASIYPFNILPEHVWHYEEDGTLFTINSRIYLLLQGIKVINNEVIVSENLRLELSEAGVVEAAYKIDFVFNFLNNCLVNKIKVARNYLENVSRNRKTIGFSYRHPFHFSADDGLEMNISLFRHANCECLRCTYRTLDFNKYLSKLKAGTSKKVNRTLEYAYGNYLVATNNYKEAYNIYQDIEEKTKSKEGQGIVYFLAKMNTLHLHNLLFDHDLESVDTLRQIREINLARVIYNELDFEVTPNVRKYLVHLSEDKLINKIK